MHFTVQKESSSTNNVLIMNYCILLHVLYSIRTKTILHTEKSLLYVCAYTEESLVCTQKNLTGLVHVQISQGCMHGYSSVFGYSLTLALNI